MKHSAGDQTFKVSLISIVQCKYLLKLESMFLSGDNSYAALPSFDAFSFLTDGKNSARKLFSSPGDISSTVVVTFFLLQKGLQHIGDEKEFFSWFPCWPAAI